MGTMGMGNGNLTQGGQTIFGTSYIVHENVIDVLVRLRSLVCLFHLHSLLEDKLELFLLVWGEGMCVLNKLNKLLISKVNSCWLVGTIWRVLIDAHILLYLCWVSLILIFIYIFHLVILVAGSRNSSEVLRRLIEIWQSMSSLNVLL
jgi:hypothetical protein